MRQATHGAMDITEGSGEEIAAAGGSAQFLHQQEQIKKGWSLLNTLHCLLLSGINKEFSPHTSTKVAKHDQLLIRNMYS